ncbi:CHC2 zinc finger domain-containing protein [Nitrosomonas sp.]|uniref:CHC2 zinc finger domain-containing protein n=1 Tax=Nitrosomonas sp. TaxID=42353 RepID=UPI0026163580|nr:CHC2 zinc finger domain-containing protein [Nitrosomonas sp.]MCW5600150.1 DNA primase [Nitrosomonas sp.]
MKGNAPKSTTSNRNVHILSCLQKVKRIGEGRFIALCPCHEDKHPSLAITFKPDGITLIHCFGCGASGLNVCKTLGIDPSVLFPPSDNHSYEKQAKHHFDAWHVLPALAFDAAVLLIAARRLNEGDKLPEADLEFLAEAVIRIQEAAYYARGKYGR